MSKHGSEEGKLVFLVQTAYGQPVHLMVNQLDGRFAGFHVDSNDSSTMRRTWSVSGIQYPQ